MCAYELNVCTRPWPYGQMLLSLGSGFGQKAWPSMCVDCERKLARVSRLSFLSLPVIMM